MNKIIMLLDNCFDPDIRVYKEAKYLINEGYDVEILCLDKKNKYIDKPEDNIDGIKVKRFFSRTDKTTKFLEKNKIGKIFKPIVYAHWLLKFMRKVRKYLKTQDFEIIHCHDVTMAFCATHYIKNKDIVFDMHEYYEKYKNKFLNKIMHHIVVHTQNKAKWIIHVNDFQIKNIAEKNRAKLVELPNYPETCTFEKIDHVDSDELRISYSGILRHKKPLKNLVIAAENLTNISITYNGRGEAYDYIKTLEKDHSYLKVTGPYKHEDISKFYANSDLIYIVYNNDCDNDRTALPTKLFEAIITTVPVVVSVNSEMENFVKKHDIGFSVDGNNIEEIKNLLEMIQQNRTILTNKINNIKKIQMQFTWDETVKALDRIYGGNEPQ